MTTHKDKVREALKGYRYKPQMDDLNPIAWEEVYLNQALSEIEKIYDERCKGCKKKCNCGASSEYRTGLQM